MKVTIVEIANRLSVERDSAYGLVKFLEVKGIIRFDSVRKAEGAKGRGSDVYEVSEETMNTIENLKPITK